MFRRVQYLSQSLSFAPRLSGLPSSKTQSHQLRITHNRSLAGGMAEAQSAPDVQPIDSNIDPRARDVLNFWFGDGFDRAPWGYFDPEKIKLWYGGGPAFDQEVTAKFGEDLERLSAKGLPSSWDTPYENLAAIVLTDQLTRNVWRGTARMYSLDALALQLSRDLVVSGAHKTLQPCAQTFAIMPLMHSESIADHELLRDTILTSIEAARPYGNETVDNRWAVMLKFGDAHSEVIKKWGRYPHRNKILGRPSTPEEEAGIADGSIPAW